MKNTVKIKIYGVNISKIYKVLKKNNIDLYNINRSDYKTLYFEVKKADLKKTKKLLNNPSYSVSIEGYKGIGKITNFFKHRFGYIIGAILFIFCLTFSNFFITDVKVYGLEKIDNIKVYEILNKNGIKVGRPLSSVDSENIKELLIDNFDDISLVSCIKKGTNILINIKEKESLDFNSNSSGDIIANFDGEIIDIKVLQGTIKVKANQAFKKGDILVSGTICDIHGNITKCQAQANITAKIKYSYTETFLTHRTEKIRTGKKIVNSNFNIFGLSLKKVNNKNTFNLYEIEHTNKYVFNNNFLPIKVDYETIYELKEIEKDYNFEDYKDDLIKKCKFEAKKYLKKDEKIENEYNEILDINGGFVVKYTYEVITRI